MSQALTLARPYARAAFAIARDGNALPAWSDALALAARVAADPRVAALLGNPKLAAADAVTLLSSDGVGEAFAQFLNAPEGSLKLVAANVVPGAGFETVIVPHVVAEAGPVKLGVTAVVDPAAFEKLNDPDKDALLPEVKKPDDVLGAILGELEGQSDYQVLMVQAPPAEARRRITVGVSSRWT